MLVQLALLVIASCGFGLRFAWDEPPKDEHGNLSIQQCLQINSEKSIMMTAAPRWTRYLPTKECVHCLFPFFKALIRKFRFRVREVNMACDTLGVFMKSQVAARKAEIRKDLAEGNTDIERDDVFSRLVLANESMSEKLSLDDEELVCYALYSQETTLTLSTVRSEMFLCCSLPGMVCLEGNPPDKAPGDDCAR